MMKHSSGALEETSMKGSKDEHYRGSTICRDGAIDEVCIAIYVDTSTLQAEGNDDSSGALEESSWKVQRQTLPGPVHTK